MRSIKIYLAVTTVFLVAAIGCGIYVWYTVQKLNTALEEESANHPASEIQEETAPASSEPIILKKDELPEAQQKMLATFGFEGESFTLTAEMVVCAENAVGKERVAQILDGRAPSAIESFKLLPCFKK